MNCCLFPRPFISFVVLLSFPFGIFLFIFIQFSYSWIKRPFNLVLNSITNLINWFFFWIRFFFTTQEHFEIYWNMKFSITARISIEWQSKLFAIENKLFGNDWKAQIKESWARMIFKPSILLAHIKWTG